MFVQRQSDSVISHDARYTSVFGGLHGEQGARVSDVGRANFWGLRRAIRRCLAQRRHMLHGFVAALG